MEIVIKGPLILGMSVLGLHVYLDQLENEATSCVIHTISNINAIILLFVVVEVATFSPWVVH